jgi:hypothetical protein
MMPTTDVSGFCLVNPAGSRETCYRVAVTGNVVVFLDDDGEGFRLRVVRGNPKNL